MAIDIGEIIDNILGFSDKAYDEGWLWYVLIGLGVLLFLWLRS